MVLRDTVTLGTRWASFLWLPQREPDGCSQWQVQMKRCWKKGCPTAASGGSAPAPQEGEPRAGKSSFRGLNVVQEEVAQLIIKLVSEMRADYQVFFCTTILKKVEEFFLLGQMGLRGEEGEKGRWGPQLPQKWAQWPEPGRTTAAHGLYTNGGPGLSHL